MEELGTEWGLVGDGRETTKTINLKRTQFQLQQVSGLTPLRDRSQVVRNGINSCSSNELNARNVQPHQKPSKTKNTTPEGHVPAWHSCPGIHVLAFMSCCTLKAGAAAVNLKFLTVQIDIQQRDDHPKGSQRTAGMAGQLIRLINGKAVCSTLLNRITNSKVSIPTSSSSTVTHKGVASSGSMAPCRSHHGYHTRQNWIFEEIHQ